MFLIEQSKQFLFFLRNPTNDLLNTKKEKIQLFLFVVIVAVVAIALFGLNDFIFECLQSLQVFKGKKIILEEPNFDRVNSNFLPWLVCLFAPLYEEALFRLPFQKKQAYFYFFTLTLVLIITFFGFNAYNLPLIFVPFTFIPYTLFKSLVKYKKDILKPEKTFFRFYFDEIYDTHFKLLFYTTTICFLFLHIDFSAWTMYNSLNAIIGYSLLFIIDLCLGYLMLRCGFIYSVLYHILYNSSLFLLDKI